MQKIIKHIILFLLLAIPATLLAQKGEAYDMMVDGVKVIVQPSGNDIVVVATVIKGGVRNYPADKAGIESLAMTALTECGTVNDDKNSFKDKLDKVSAQMFGSAGKDFSGFSMNCIKSDFETVWPLYMDALTAPRFDAKEFERIRQDAINNIRNNESNPDFAVDKMARQNAFAGKDYAKDPGGTIEIVGKLTAADTKKYFQSILAKSRIFIVITGDLDKSSIEKKVKELLAKVPAGAPFKTQQETYAPTANSFKPESRENATNYVEGITGGPQPGTPDYNAYVLAMRIFYNRHFLEIRTKNGLSYAPAVWFSPGVTPYSNIYVTTTDPDKYIAVARNLVDKIKSEGFTAEELRNMKTEYLTGFYYNQETNYEQANSLAMNEAISGDWRRALRINEDMKKVTLDQVNNTFKKYFSNITWSYQGDTKKVDPQLFTQKETPKIPVDKKAF